MRKHRTAEQWQVLIGQQRDSGLSATQFCKEHKLGYASFCSWRMRRLSQPVCEAADSGYASFLELSSLMDDSASPGSGWNIGLSLGNGVELRLSQIR